MEKGKVVVDMPATNCRVRPYKPGSIPGHLVYDQDFTWPMAPTVDGGRVFTISKWGDVFCLDAATGAVLWQRGLRQAARPGQHGRARGLERGLADEDALARRRGARFPRLRPEPRRYHVSV